MGKYVLVVTEKPSSAKRIAEALDNGGSPKHVEENGVPYYIAHREKKLVVFPALGHLYTVTQGLGGRNYYPVLNFEWVPKYMVERDAKRTRFWIETASKLSEDASEFIVACDYDVEGSLIGYCLLKYACGHKDGDAKRMKFSTLTKTELVKAYENQLSHLDFPLIKAGKTRHEVDWLYGVNISRALTLAAKRMSGTYTTLSAGRVQGPALSFLVDREHEIREFVPTPFWSIRAEVKIGNEVFKVEYEKEKFERKMDAETVVKDCRGKVGVASKIEKQTTCQMPPPPLNLRGLQTEAYRLFGYSPMLTAKSAQRLYLAALISYPRTSSQKLPPVIGYDSILKKLGREPEYKRFSEVLLKVEKLKPREGKLEDSAHPAIYPTGRLPQERLGGSEKKVWDLIVRRFMVALYEPAVKQTVNVSIEVDKHVFHLRGRKIVKDGWMRFFKPLMRSQEVLLPSLKEGDNLQLAKITKEREFTRPPARFNPSSLLKKMDDEGIGTKSTRTDIIQTLYSRKYVRGERITVTDLGFDLIGILKKFCPDVVSVSLTRTFEERMKNIQRNVETRESILVKAVEALKPMMEELKKSEEVLGEALTTAIRKSRIEERLVGACPTCGSGKLMIIYSRKTGKRFLGCSNYFKSLCKTSFPLPQKGIVKTLGRNCESCKWPVVQVKIKGKKPWILCFNPKCPRVLKRRK